MCQLKDVYTVYVIWFVYQPNSTQIISSDQYEYSLAQNGQNLTISNMTLSDFLASVFECNLNYSGGVAIANFTTVTVPGKSLSYEGV